MFREAPTIALTAFPMDGDWSKPINPEAFVSEVEAFLPDHLRAPARGGSP